MTATTSASTQAALNQRRERDRLRTALQAPIGPLRICVLYLVNGEERRTPWLHSRERAQEALCILQAKYGEGRAVLYRD